MLKKILTSLWALICTVEVISGSELGSNDKTSVAPNSNSNQRRLTPCCEHESHVDNSSTRIQMLAQPLAPNHQDPRHLDACRAVHKSRGLGQFSINTIGDDIASSKYGSHLTDGLKYYDKGVGPQVKKERRSFERSLRSMGCRMLHPYGDFVQSIDKQSQFCTWKFRKQLLQQ